jgi:malonyl-CoA O-methyltransferase
MSGIAVDYVLPERSAARRQFARVAGGFGNAGFIHARAREQLLGRLEFLKLDPTSVLDLGAAQGAAEQPLKSLYPRARQFALDSCPAMLRQRTGGNAFVGEAERMPCRDGSIDLIFANLLLPWCEPQRSFREWARVLSGQGLIVFSSFGPDTLAEVRRAWAVSGDQDVHVHAFVDMHDLGSLLLAAGMVEPVLDSDRIDITYPDVRTLVADLRGCGASNVAYGRRRALTGPARWRRFAAGLERAGDRFGVTVELIFGQAWKDVRSPSSDGAVETTVPISAIRRR